MKLLSLLSIVLAIVITGCSKADKPAAKEQAKKATPEETAVKILQSGAIPVEGQGDLTKEELENAKNTIAVPAKRDLRKRAIGREQGGPPAPTGIDRKKAEAKRHINTK
jgi:hypothetical protein